MTRRRFRYSKELDAMVEIPVDTDYEPVVGIHGEIQPFVSPRDGTIIKSKAHLREYMAKHSLVHHDPSMKKVEDRYAQGHADRALREQLYERVDRMTRDPAVRKYLRDRR
jgi:hypothetical protein